MCMRKALLVSVLLLAGCQAPVPVAAKSAAAVSSPQVEAVLSQVEQAYAQLGRLDTHNHALMRVAGQEQHMNQTLSWDTSARTLRWQRLPLIIEIARDRVSVIRQGKATHRTASGTWADTIEAVTGAASAVPAEVKLQSGAARAAWLDAVTAGTIGVVEAQSVETKKTAAGHEQHHVALTGTVGSGTMVIEGATGLLVLVETQAQATLPDGRVLSASARITFDRTD